MFLVVALGQMGRKDRVALVLPSVWPVETAPPTALLEKTFGATVREVSTPRHALAAASAGTGQFNEGGVIEWFVVLVTRIVALLRIDPFYESLADTVDSRVGGLHVDG